MNAPSFFNANPLFFACLAFIAFSVCKRKNFVTERIPLVKSYGKSYVCCNPYCDSVKIVSFTIIVYFFLKNIWLN